MVEAGEHCQKKESILSALDNPFKRKAKDDPNAANTLPTNALQPCGDDGAGKRVCAEKDAKAGGTFILVPPAKRELPLGIPSHSSAQWSVEDADGWMETEDGDLLEQAYIDLNQDGVSYHARGFDYTIDLDEMLQVPLWHFALQRLLTQGSSERAIISECR